jgi:4-amino-4-deoxy-L-arabinose transferase-like glycosyltransferase
MLILLLPATFISVFFTLAGYHARQHTPLADWRTAFLQSATVLGGYMVLFSEFLSLFHALTQIWIAFFWALALIISIILGWKTGWGSEGFSSLKNSWVKPDWFDILAGAILSVVLVLLLYIAVKSPVNNNDALRYHLARVVHWIQDQSLSHFATAYLPQVMHPIGAELEILNTYLLWGNDRLVNLVQWIGLVGTIVAVAGLVSLLGGSKSSLWLAIAFAVSLPIAILESSSAQNDLVTAFWFVVLLYSIFLMFQHKGQTLDVITIGLSLGMGLLTKATFYAYALIPLIYMTSVVFQKYNLRQSIRNLTIIGALAILLNLGFWTRNTLSFGSPFGQRDFVAVHLTHEFHPGLLVTSVIRNISQNLVTPSDSVNAKIVSILKTRLSAFDPTMQQFNLEWGWNHEDLAGNPLHTILIIISLFLLVIFRHKVISNKVWPYLSLVLASYWILSVIIKYDLFGIRYQLPFFMAFAPLFGISIESIDQKNKKNLYRVITILLLLSAFPWVIFNRTRPLIAMRDSTDPYTIPCLAGCTTGSILNEPPEKTMFAVWGTLGGAYVDAMKQVKGTGCKEIGLKLDSSDLEYAYWYLLGAPQNGVRLENLVTYPELERYLDPNFKPCVIICTTCGNGLMTLDSLNLIGEYSKIKIYADRNGLNK